MAARIEELPVGLDWPAFLTAYFPGGRRNGLKDVAASIEYGQLPRGGVEGEEATMEAVRAREDDGGSTRGNGRASPRLPVRPEVVSA